MITLMSMDPDRSRASTSEWPTDPAEHTAHISLRVCLAAFLIVAASCPAWSMGFSGWMGIDAATASGHSTNRTTFDGGSSTLRWPIDVKAPAVRAGISLFDLLDLDFRIVAEPWGTNDRVMKDYDYLDEAQFPGRQPHPGVDIYSETALDSKALVMSVDTRVFPLRGRYASAGLTAGYRREEYDYRGYNTRQTGFGTWQDQTNTASGPTMLYSVEYDIWSMGIVLAAHLDDTVILTIGAASLPHIRGRDEGEHLKRNRASFTRTTGSGYQTSLSGAFHITPRWTLGSECLFTRISSDGSQTQFWYGDDPATPGFNDTGYRLPGIDAELDMEYFRFTIGSMCRF